MSYGHVEIYEEKELSPNEVEAMGRGAHAQRDEKREDRGRQIAMKAQKESAISSIIIAQ